MAISLRTTSIESPKAETRLQKFLVHPKPHISPPEKKMRAMEEYISEVLQQGYNRQSRSPVMASFFFIEKNRL